MDLLLMPTGALLLLLVGVVALLTLVSDPYQVDNEEKRLVEREKRRA